MNNSKIKQLLAAALIAEGLFLTGKAIFKANKNNSKIMRHKLLNTPVSKENCFSLITDHNTEINSIYNEVKDFFTPKELDSNNLLDMNASPAISFKAEEANYKTHKIELNYPTKKEVTGYSKIIFSGIDNFATDIILRVYLEGWEGYVDFILYSCISKVQNNKNFLQVVSVSPYLLDSLSKNDIIVLERINKKTNSENSFSVQNMVSGTELITTKYHNN